MRIEFAFVAPVLLLGCAADMGRLKVASATPPPVEYRMVAQRVEAERCLSSLLLIVPLGLTIPDLQGVVDDAVREAKGANALVGAEFYESSFISLLYNRICYGVRGDAVAAGNR
jgi:hypothetical protein